MKKAVIPTVLAALAAAGSASYYEVTSYLTLDACASSNNVYACRWEAVPEEGPRIVYQPAEILPPPVNQ